MSVPSYEQRILEIHGINMWNMFHVDRAIRFAKRHKMTGIAFHCNELIDKVVFPEKYFTKDELLKYNPCLLYTSHLFPDQSDIGDV